MANKTETEIEAPKEDDEVCCGMLLFQVGFEWICCPYCGEDLPDWAVFSDVVMAKGGD